MTMTYRRSLWELDRLIKQTFCLPSRNYYHSELKDIKLLSENKKDFLLENKAIFMKKQ